MIAATPTSTDIAAYGRHNETTIDVEPFAICAISPLLGRVCVAGGVCVTVLVVIMPFVLVANVEEESEVEATLLLSLVVDVEFDVELSGFVTWMHPLGEHSSCEGQQPPPVAPEHSTVDSMHFGGLFADVWQFHGAADVLQQNIPDREYSPGWQAIPTGQQIF